MKLSTVTRRGQRIDKLQTLALNLSKAIEACMEDGDCKAMAQLSKQYRDTIREIEEIKGPSDEEDELQDLLSKRSADGKPGAIR